MVDMQFALLVAALVCFVLAAVGINGQRIGLLPLGLAFWALSILVR